MYFAIFRKCFLSQSVLSLTHGNGCIISRLVATDSYTHAWVNPSTVPLGVLQPHSLIFFLRSWVSYFRFIFEEHCLLL